MWKERKDNIDSNVQKRGITSNTWNVQQEKTTKCIKVLVALLLKSSFFRVENW